MMKLTVNGRELETDATPDTPLLWVLRDHLGLTGTKFGCGMALCGACTVHLNGQPIRSCSTPVSAAATPQPNPLTSDCVKATMLPHLSAAEKLVVPIVSRTGSRRAVAWRARIFWRCSAAYAFETRRATGIWTSLPVL